MKKTLLFALALVSFQSFGQGERPVHLDSSEVASRYTEEIIQNLKIKYPIFKVFEFRDKLGTHELVLTEHSISGKDNDSISAYCYHLMGKDRILEWKLNDFISWKEGTTPEKSIWFWTRYLRLDDIDKNGTIDPIIVYGTADKNGSENGRLKFLLYLNGNKYAIRHVNSDMDWGRNTRVDESYYELPAISQSYMESLMHLIYENGHAIFPAEWEENMKSKKLFFDEN